MNEDGKELVRKILAVESPGEVFAVDYYEPPRPGKKFQAGDGPLGIGIEVGLFAILPIVWKIIDEITIEARKETSKGLAALVKQYWDKKLLGQLKGNRDEFEKLLVPVLAEYGINSNHNASLAKSIANALATHELNRKA